MSLAKRNLLFFAIVMTIIFGLATIFVYFQTKNEILDQGKERADAVIQSFEAMLNSGTNDFDSHLIQVHLDQLKKHLPELDDFTVYNIEKKQAIASSNKENQAKAADPEDIEAAKKDQTVIIIENEDGGTVVDVTAPLHINGKIDYVCGVAFSMDDEIERINALLIQNSIISFVLLILGIFLVWYFNIRKMSRQLKEIKKVSNEVAKGNLSTKSTVMGKDEIGQLSHNINYMSESLAQIVGNVIEGTGQISEYSNSLAEVSDETSASVDEIAKTVDELAKGATEQTIKAKEGAEKLLALAEQINNVMESSKQIKYYATETSKLNKNGKESIQVLAEKFKENKDNSLRMETNASNLLGKSSSISQVVDTIQSIAEQTNLLALNAAIEAARAGEQGKGFAVVADEIQKLAEQTSSSTKVISNTVKEIQDEIHSTKNNIDTEALSIEEANNKLLDTTRAFETASEAVTKIIEHLDGLNSNIQVIGADKDGVVCLINEISAISDNNAAATEEVSATVEEQAATIDEISNTAEKLKQVVVEFNKLVNEFKI